MSGHSKWATTKHKKAALDAKRGKLFAKLIKNIEVACRNGGADPAGNPTLFDAIQKARKSSVPADNIDRAIKRGSGAEAGGANYETIMYEGYGPNGVAVLVECLSDNRNRAASEVRVAMTRNGGTMADPGSVSYLFNRRGIVMVPKSAASEDAVLSANYILASLKDVMTAPFGDGPCMHEALFDDHFLDGTGVTTLDFAKAMIDEGYHPMTMYFPLVVHGALLIEPTESQAKEDIDQFVAALRSLAERAKSGNAVEEFKAAPRFSPRRRLDETLAARKPVLRWRPSNDFKQAAE